MPRNPEPDRPAPAPAQVVGPVIQDLAAARLGRAFVPLVLLVLFGLGGILRGGGAEAFLLAVGGPVSAGAMLAFGMRVAHAAFGRPRRPWMAWAAVAGVLPPTYGIWVLAWLGLRRLAAGGGAPNLLVGLVLASLGFWVLRSWLRIVELQRLAEAMTLPVGDTPGGEAEGP